MDWSHTNAPIEILIVDDEPQAVKYFKKAFGGNYSVLTATSADEAEALVLSGQHNIGLVITDQRMPGRSGVNLLNRIRQERPDIIRMLTTAYADLDSAIEAVNKGEVYRYLTKPWDLRVLEAEIEQALTFYMLRSEYQQLLRDKLSALQRALLRDRINSFAVMSSALPVYRNAPLSIYNFLKDSLAETSWRFAVQRQWALLRAQDHWRIPVDETNRMMKLSEDLADPTLAPANDNGGASDIVSVVTASAERLNRREDGRRISIRSGSDSILVAADQQVLGAVIDRVLEPMSRWAAAGTPLQVRISKEFADNQHSGVKIHLETQNCEPAKALADCVLHAQPLHPTPEPATEFFRAALAIGHMGGSLRAPPMENGYKQLIVMLPGNEQRAPLFGAPPRNWVQDLNDDYEKWVLGTIDMGF